MYVCSNVGLSVVVQVHEYVRKILLCLCIKYTLVDAKKLFSIIHNKSVFIHHKFTVIYTYVHTNTAAAVGMRNDGICGNIDINIL